MCLYFNSNVFVCVIINILFIEIQIPNRCSLEVILCYCVFLVFIESINLFSFLLDYWNRIGASSKLFFMAAMISRSPMFVMFPN